MRILIKITLKIIKCKSNLNQILENLYNDKFNNQESNINLYPAL
jgi:hypothetical protein